MNEVKVLNQTEMFGKTISVYGTKENPLFRASDVADWIDVKNTSVLIQRIEQDEVTKLNLGSLQGETWFLTEDGLYEVLMQSRKPIAKQFKKGVKQILKEIRTQGAYVATSGEESDEELMARALEAARRTIARKEERLKQLEADNENERRRSKRLEAENEQQGEEIKKLTPDAEYARQTLSAINTWNTNLIAKEMGMSAVTLNQHLQRLGIQYKQHKVWILNAKYQNYGLTKTQTFNYTNSNGEACTRMQMEWTEKGRRWLLDLWKQGKFVSVMPEN